MISIESIEFAFPEKIFGSYVVPEEEGDWEQNWRLKSLNDAFSGKTWKEIDHSYCSDFYDMFSALPAMDVCKIVPAILYWIIGGRDVTEIVETILTQFGITNRAADIVGIGFAQRIAFPEAKPLWKENRKILASSFSEAQIGFFATNEPLVAIASQIDLAVARTRFLRWSMNRLRSS